MFELKKPISNELAFHEKDIRHYFSTPSVLQQRPFVTSVATLQNGCFGCGRNCRVCSVKNKEGTMLLLQGDFLWIEKWKNMHTITQRFDCRSNWCIYLIACICCNTLYVGSTKAMAKTRISQHISAITNCTDSKKYPMVAHFNNEINPCFDEKNKLKYMRVMIVDGIKESGITNEIADGRLNKLEIQYQKRWTTWLRSGNDTRDVNNSGYNRRNFTNKYVKESEVIVLERGGRESTKNPKIWNQSWRKNEEGQWEWNTEYLLKFSSIKQMMDKYKRAKRK